MQLTLPAASGNIRFQRQPELMGLLGEHGESEHAPASWIAHYDGLGFRSPDSIDFEARSQALPLGGLAHHCMTPSLCSPSSGHPKEAV